MHLQPRHPLPPTHDLEAFEAAARHLSFLRASDELCITQSAVSHRIKSLEEAIGVRLFVRVNRAIALTSAGNAYLPAVRDALDALRAATQAVRRAAQAHTARGQVRLCVMPALGSRWLVAKLAEFQKAYPDIDVAVDTPFQADAIAAGAFDFGIRFEVAPGSDALPQLRSLALIDQTVFPIASASLARNLALRKPEDLIRARLLRHPLLSWEAWCAAANMATLPLEGTATFEDASLLYEAVAAGHGVALMPSTLFATYAAERRGARRLQRLFKVALTGQRYAIVLRQTAPSPYAAALIDWLTQTDYMHNFHASLKKFRL